jgi:FkbM family methyltransferase
MTYGVSTPGSAGRRPPPNLESLNPEIVGRVLMTVSCTDADLIPKVEQAGEVREWRGQPVQVMHNGLLVEEGGYYGDWMTEIIRTLKGHHEPQEERVFDQIVRRLATDGPNGTMIEFGSFWTYYGMWFCQVVPSGRVIAVEPDPSNIEVGRRNVALNDLSDRIAFVQAAIGDHPGLSMPFRAESDGQEYSVAQCDLESVLESAGVTRADLILADVQGAETMLLERAADLFRAGRVRFLIVSTHHQSISGSPLTHQRALELLTEAGGHVLCEHSVFESFSGDGLIAVSFDERDRDLVIEISRARSKDSLYGEAEYEIEAMGMKSAFAEMNLEGARNELVEVRNGAAGLAAHVTFVEHEREELRGELDRVFQTKLWRWSQIPRRTYARIRSRGG